MAMTPRLQSMTREQAIRLLFGVHLARSVRGLSCAPPGLTERPALTLNPSARSNKDG